MRGDDCGRLPGSAVRSAIWNGPLLRANCVCPLPGLVSLRRAVGSATGPLIRPGTDLLLTAAVLVPATPAQSILLPRAKHLP